MKNKIYCIGDSHSKMFAKRYLPKEYIELENYFKICHVGPSTAYNLTKTKTTTRGREKLFKILNTIPKKSTVMLFFGEVDCRLHLIKQMERQGRSMGSITKECVNRYFSVISEIIDMGFNVIVFNVVASTFLKKMSKRVPWYGDLKTRNKVSIKFNKYLSALCKDKEKCIFIDIFDKLINNKMKTRDKYYRDDVHLGAKAFPLVLGKMNKLIDNFNYRK